MKICNNGYCNHKLTNGECSYQEYCDYQTPRDSRSIERNWASYPDYCLCAGQMNTAGNCIVCGKKKS